MKTGGGPPQKPNPFTDLVNAILGEGSALSSGIAVHGTDSSSTETCESQDTVVSRNSAIPKEEYVATVGGGAVASSSVVASSSLVTIHGVDCVTAGSDPCEVLLARSSPSRPASANANLSQEGIAMTPTTWGMKRRSAASEKQMNYDAGLQQLNDSQVETDQCRRELYKSATALNNFRIEREQSATALNNLRIEREQSATGLNNLRIEREQLEIRKHKRELGLE